VFSVYNSNNTNASGADHIAYCFAEVAGYSKFGKYTGNGNADGTFVYTGFKPSIVIVKSTGSQNNWEQRDNKRPGYNLTSGTLYTNDSAAENTGEGIDMVSNGFKLRASGNGQNGSHTYVYMAFGQPIVSNSGQPGTAR
jgi:hypothetical protein